MNQLIQVVTLGGDPELKTYGNEGKSVVSFSGAVPRRYAKNDEEKTNWFNYVAFGATADFIAKYFKKGSKMLMIGEVNNNNYTKEDGTKVYGTQILINSVEFFGKKSDGDVSSNDNVPTASNNSATSEPSKAESAPATQSYDAYDDF